MTWTDTALAAIVVAVITATGGIVVAIISRKNDKSSKETSKPLPSISNGTLSASTERSESTPPKKVLIVKQISDVAHSAIAEHITRVPPFQRDSIEAHYIGLRVRWRVILHSVGVRAAGAAHLHGDVSETKTAIDCDGTKEDFASLIHAAEGEEIEVEGTIDLVSRAYTILKDCIAYRVKKESQGKSLVISPGNPQGYTQKLPGVIPWNPNRK